MSILRENWMAVGGAIVSASVGYLLYRAFTTRPKKTTFVFLQHSDNVPPALLYDFLKSKKAATRIVHLDREPLPELNDRDVYISLGGHMGAYDDRLFDFIGQEKKFMVEAVKRDIPIFGICLGCQLLADALGGKAYPSPSFEAGFPILNLTAEGKNDSVIASCLGSRLLVHHGDTFTLPPKATLLASTIYPQAFRLGSAFGVQFHPEATTNELRKWGTSSAGVARYASIGLDKSELLREAERRSGETQQAAMKLFDAWFQSLPSKYRV